MKEKFLGRLLLIAGLSVLVTLFAWETFGNEITVIQVKGNIPLSDDEPVFRDYYLSGGLTSGLKNLVVQVVRKNTVKDASGTQTHGDIDIPVAHLRVISLNEKIAIAREFKESNREAEPVLELEGVMVGDRIDLKGSYVDNKKAPAKKTAKVDSTPVPTLPVAAPVQTVPSVAPATAPAPVVTTSTEPERAPAASPVSAKEVAPPTKAQEAKSAISVTETAK